MQRIYPDGPYLLDPFERGFPAPEQALDEPNGLLAVGGDLSPERLLEAYRHGIFPWFSPGEPLLWWSPDPRGVILPGDAHLSRSLRKRLRRGDYTTSMDRAFPEVIRACAAPREIGGGTWITREMQAAYIALHRLGYAHSVETWRDDELVGGLYGISLGAAFYGESMFSRTDDASKVAYARLVEQTAAWGFGLIDAQLVSPHMQSLGTRPMRRSEFLALNQRMQASETRLGPWTYTGPHAHE